MAERAGVSIATVSRVLSGSRPVRPDVAERVREASEALGYRRNLLASSLRRQRTGTVGVVVPNAGDLRHARLVQALSQELHQRGDTLLMAHAQGSPEIEKESALRLLDRAVDGLVIVPCDVLRSRGLVATISRRVHVVQIENDVGVSGVDLIAVDEGAGVRLMLGHLAELGRRRTLFVAEEGPEAGSARLEAYRRAAEAGRTTAVAEPVLGVGGMALGREVAERVAVRGAHRVEAIVCGDDLVALGVLDGLRAQSLAVPGDVAVTGFDDVGLAELASPSLTTVHRPLTELAAAAVERLAHACAGEGGPAVVWRLPPTIVVRESTVAPR
ncbi:MAG: LacI family DNA-binding transcriptional regulator [Actinomycetota bacterium]